MKKITHTCLQCRQRVKPYARGLCQPCYQAAWYAVSNGVTTWAKLIKAGLAGLSNRRLFRKRIAKLKRVLKQRGLGDS